MHVKQTVNCLACGCGFCYKLRCGRFAQKSELSLALQQQRVDSLRVVGVLYSQFAFLGNVAVVYLLDAGVRKHLVKYVLRHLSHTDTVQYLSLKRVEVRNLFRAHDVQQTVGIDTEQHIVALGCIVHRGSCVCGKHCQFQFTLRLGSLGNDVLRILRYFNRCRSVADFTVGNDFCHGHCGGTVGCVQRYACRGNVLVGQVGLTRRKREYHCRNKNNQSDY